MKVATRLLAPHISGRHIVELGCGSGLLAEQLIKLDVASYQGYDISDVAVARARQRLAGSQRGGLTRFDVAAVSDLLPQGEALIVSLGLIEWLTPTELDHLFNLSQLGSFLHAFSEQRHSLSQLIHRIYVRFSYGRKSGGYVPRYHQLSEIDAIAKRYGFNRLGIYRHPQLRFGTFVSNLSFESTPALCQSKL